jgi:hypothetical protein
LASTPASTLTSTPLRHSNGRATVVATSTPSRDGAAGTDTALQLSPLPSSLLPSTVSVVADPVQQEYRQSIARLFDQVCQAMAVGGEQKVNVTMLARRAVLGFEFQAGCRAASVTLSVTSEPQQQRQQQDAVWDRDAASSLQLWELLMLSVDHRVMVLAAAMSPPHFQQWRAPVERSHARARTRSRQRLATAGPGNTGSVSGAAAEALAPMVFSSLQEWRATLHAGGAGGKGGGARF